jgi:uncharacterized protein
LGYVADRPDSARVVRMEDLVGTPWPNGRGRTSEIYRQLSVQHPEKCTWRLSLATIDTPGPFSVLPEARRCLLLASDTSLSLSIDGRVHTLRYTDSVVFDGGAAVEVIAVSGVSRALNLMTYGGVGGQLQVSRLSDDVRLSDREDAALVVLDGRLLVGQEALGRYDTLILGPQSVEVRCDAATVVRVSVGEPQGEFPRPTSGRGAGSSADADTASPTPTIDQRGD